MDDSLKNQSIPLGYDVILFQDGKNQNRVEKIQQIARDTVKKIDSFPITPAREGYIAGILALKPYSIEEAIAYYGYEPFYGTDNIHYSMDIAYLDLGIDAMLEKLSQAIKSPDAIKAAYAKGVCETWQAVQRHILCYAHALKNREGERFERIHKNCLHVAHKAPETFEQALQLFWFVWTIRSEIAHIHFRNPGYYMAPFGRWDQHLWKYYKHDIETGTATREEIYELVKDAFLKVDALGSGDTLKNMMLGGQDKYGNDQANDLSLLIMDVILEIKTPEPHLNGRVYPSMNPEYYKRLVDLGLLGQGHGEIFVDEAIIPKLRALGIPDDIAFNYCCDGCEEIIIDRYGAILFKELEALKALELAYFNGEENPYQGNKDVQRWAKEFESREIKTALITGHRSGDMRKASSYEEVYQMFLDQFKFQVDKLIKFMDDSMAFYDTACISSMVLAGGYLESLETGSDPFKDVIKYMFFEIQSGAITPVADALAGIKKVVFEEKFVSMDELITALSKNFEGYEVLRKKLLAAPKFGNDDDYVDLIAKDISGNFCKWINDHRVAHKDRYLLPAIYSIFFLDHSFLTSATSDGRLCGDPIAVQFSPGPGRARHGPTAVLQSVSKTDLTQGAGGSTVFLTISRNLVPYNAEGKTLVDVFFKAAVEYNVPVLSIAINDVEALKDAQKRPELYEDLVVRVWGFNARFVDLTVDMQNHIINRTVGAAG